MLLPLDVLSLSEDEDDDCTGKLVATVALALQQKNA